MNMGCYAYSFQFGASLASLVESSNRTSAHCNVLDALVAAERTTAICALVDSSSGDAAASGVGAGAGAGASSSRPSGAVVGSGAVNGSAVGSVAAAGTTTGTASTPVASNTTSASAPDEAGGIAAPAVRQQPDPRSWESLAEFLFGPDWLSIQLPGDELEPKLVREYEEQRKAEGKYVPPQRSTSTGAGTGTGTGAGTAAVTVSAAVGADGSAGGGGKTTTESTDTVSSILAEAAQLAATASKSSSRAATPTGTAAAAAAAVSAATSEAGTASTGGGDKPGTKAAAAEGSAAGNNKAGEKTAQTIAPAPRKGKQLPATALMPANAPDGLTPGTPGATAAAATNAVNVNTPGSIGKTAGPGGKALPPSGGGGGSGAAAAASGGDKSADATPAKDGESSTPPTSQGVNTTAGLGGKAVPQDEKGSAPSSGANEQDDEDDKVVPTASVGWDAPFPEEIPPYPLLASHSHRVDGRDTSKGPANPHKLPFGVPLGLHLAHLVGAEEACRIDYGPNGPRKHRHKVGKSMATFKAEREEERKRRKAERAAGNSAADRHTAELLDAAHKLAQEHAAARAKAKAEDQLKEVPEAYFSAAALGSSYWGSVLAASTSATAAATGDSVRSEDKMEIDTSESKVAGAAVAEGADKDAAGRKRARFEDEAEGGSAAKRVRTEFGAVPATPQTPTAPVGQGSKPPTTAAAASAAASQRRRPGYVPQFLPPFPPARTYLGGADGSGNAEQAVAELLRSGGAAGGSSSSSTIGGSSSLSTTRRGTTLTLDSDEVGRSLGVRKSLVGLGSTRSAVSGAPWGAPAGGVTAPAVLDHVSVPAGRRTGPLASGPTAGKKSPTNAGAAAAAGIQPLSRASNARVSKILEGSLDAN